jgi:ADP-ribosylation factor protein 6
MGGSTQSRILVLGIDGSGKTTFLNRVENPKKDIDATPTESYETRDVKLSGVKFNVWDVSGKPSVRSLWSSYYKQGGIDAIIWVVDSADKDRLEEAKKTLHAQMRDPELQGKMLFLIANKQDVSGAMSPDDIEKEFKLKQFEGKRAYFTVGCSSKTGDGVKNAMKVLAKQIKVEIKRVEKGEPLKSDDDHKDKEEKKD